MSAKGNATQQRIDDLISTKGVACPLNGNVEQHRIELSLDYCQVHYINNEIAYNREGQIFSLSEFKENNSVESVCAVLDVISESD